MKKAVQKLFSFLMALVMVFEAVPAAVLAEPIAVDEADPQKVEIVLPEKQHTLTEDEYSVAPADASGFIDLLETDGEDPASGQRMTGCFAYDIVLTPDAVLAEEYRVTVPVRADMLANADQEQNPVFDGAEYALFQVYTDENSSRTAEPMGSFHVEEENGWISSVTFDTRTFSTFVLKYSADFHYNGRDYSNKDGMQMLLSDLIEKLEIMNGDVLLNVADVASVVFADEYPVTVQQVSGLICYNNVFGHDAGEKDFLLTTDALFTSEEQLTITLINGETIEVGSPVIATVEAEEKAVDYSDKDREQMLLSDLIGKLTALGVELPKIDLAEAVSVVFTGEHAVSVQQVSGLISYNNVPDADVGENDFLLTSEEPFTSEEQLIITLKSGDTVEIGAAKEKAAAEGVAEAAGDVKAAVVYSIDAGLPASVTLTAEAVDENDRSFQLYRENALARVAEILTKTEEAPQMLRDVAPKKMGLLKKTGIKGTNTDESTDNQQSAKGDSSTADPQTTRRQETRLAGVFNLTILDGDEPCQPDAPVTVIVELDNPLPDNCTVHAVHFTDDGMAEAPIPATVVSPTQVSFPASGFSVYAITYTVEYIVGGREYSIAGGGVMSLRNLLSFLSVDIQIEEIKSVRFSNEELVRVAYVAEDTAAGALKEALGVTPSYSAELTEEDIAVMDAVELTAPDWALISLKPFKTNETLTLLLTNGQEYEIAVTDGQIVRYYIDSKGDTYEINVTFEDDAEIPEGADLAVAEIGLEDEAYQDYLAQAIQALGGSGTAEYARFFDITIMHGGVKVTPKAPVTVTIALADAPEGEELKVVHFDEENGLVVMEAETDKDDNLLVTADSFSVYGVIAVPDEPSTYLDGQSATIHSINGTKYVLASTMSVQVSTSSGNQNLTMLEKSSEAAPPSWTFEATGAPNVYNIYTYDANNIKQYINLSSAGFQETGHGGWCAHATLSTNPQGFTVDYDGSNYYIYRNFDGKDYYLIQYNGIADTYGYAGYYLDNVRIYSDVKLEFSFTSSALATDLDGKTATISYNSNYMTSTYVPAAESGDTSQLQSTTTAGEATVFQFEDAGEAGKYYISTISGGQKKYLRLYSHGDNWSDANLDTTPQVFTVSRDGEGYLLSTITERSGNPVTQYLRYRTLNHGNGFSGSIYDVSENNLTLNFANPTIQDSSQYILMVKHEGSYYVIHNDGTLAKVDDPNNTTGLFEIDDPMVWQYNGDNLYHPTKETGFTWENLAIDYFWRYLDPDVAQGYTDENSGNTAMNWNNTVSYHTLKDQIKINYEDNTISSQTNPLNYIGIVRGADGRLRIAGQQSAENAAEIYFVKMIEEAAMSYDDAHHTVNHIDISIVGHAALSVPLAYGKYYYKDESGNVQTLIVTRENPVTVELAQDVDVTEEDIKRAEVTAYTIDANGQQHIIDNAFYISGFSGNNESAVGSTNQTRIEGVFKVADLPTIEVENGTPYIPAYKDNNGVQHAKNNNTASVHFSTVNTYNGNGQIISSKQVLDIPERLNHKIYYSVATTKQITFDLMYNNHRLYETAAEAQADTGDGVKKGTTTVTLSNSFDYWDLRNECPPLYIWGQTQAWKDGRILYGGTAKDGSGMDFQLGTVDKDKYGILAVEITKYIIDEAGNAITPMENVNNVFTVHYKKGTTERANPEDVIGVKGMDVNAYANGAPDYSGYTGIHTKITTVGEGGSGSVYDYDVNAGMVYIEEDKTDKNLPKSIVDVNGKVWNYAGTRIETEYVWRDDGIENSRHVSKKYTTSDANYRSHPEVLGTYTDEKGIDRYNGFLEFFVYNIYQAEPIDVPIKKVWKYENGSIAPAPAGATVTVTLGRYKLAPDPENSVNGSLQINHTVSGTETNSQGTYKATYKVKQSNKVLRSGSYTSGTLTMNDLPEGSYTLEITESVNGYDYDEPTTMNGQATTSMSVTIVKDQTTNVTINTKLKQASETQLVTVTVKNWLKDDITPYQNMTYTFPAGSSIVFTIYRPAGQYQNQTSGFQVWAGVNDNWDSTPNTTVGWPTLEDPDQWIYVDQEWEYPNALNANTEIGFRHNWGSNEFYIKAVELKKGSSSASSQTPASSTNTGSGSSVTNQPEQQPGSVTGTMQAATDGQITLLPGGSAPASNIPGMMYTPDTEWAGEEVTLSSGHWEDVFTELLAADPETGYQYLYYIKRVDEHGLPSGCQAAIDMKDGSINLVSDGDTTLGITNTIPNQKPSVTIKKVDENGQPLTGVTFQFAKDNGNPESFTVDGTGMYTRSNLEPGTYTITELALTGYEAISGNISFTVQDNAIVNPSYPSEVSFDGENYTFTVRNTPTNDGNLKIVKRWQDIHGNNLPAGEIPDRDVNLTLYQLAQNEGPKHNVKVIIRYKGDEQGHNKIPENYSTYGYHQVDMIEANGWGTAIVTVNWNQYTQYPGGAQSVTVDPNDGFITVIDDNKKGSFTATLWDKGDGNDATFYIDIDNNNWGKSHDSVTIQFSPSTKPGNGFTMTGGTRSVTLTKSANWTKEFTFSGNENEPMADNGSTVLPATYQGRPCRYIIAEDSIPADFTVTYSNSNADGEGSRAYTINNGSVGVLTAYNRKITMNVSLHKVDKNHLENGLEGARFQIYKINPEQTGVVYMDWAYNYGSGNTYLETTSGNNCTVTFSDLPIGYYEIVETPPTNYLNDGPFYIKVTKQGIAVLEKDNAKRPDKWHIRSNDSTISVSGASGITIGNSRDAKLVKLKKYAENVSGTGHGNDRTNVAGAQFKIYTWADQTHALRWDSPELGGSDVKRYFAEDNETMTSGSDGTFYYGSIALGTYVLVETAAPAGFDQLAHPVKMQVLSNGTNGYNVVLNDFVTDVELYKGTIDSTGVFYNAFIPNDRKPVSLTVTKKDETNGNPLDGSTFVLYDDEQLEHSVKTYENTNASSFTISSSDSEISTLLAPIGKDGSLTLYLRETQAPTGYSIIDHTYEIVITKAATGYAMTIDGVSMTTTGGTVTLDVPNPPDGSLTVAKEWRNADGTTDWPEGASVQFTLYKTVNGTKTQVAQEDLPANSTEKTNPVTLTSDKQTARWDHLPTTENVNGQDYPVTYTAEESGLEDGTITISGAVYDSIATVVGKTTTFTNYERITVNFEKTWETDIEPAQYTVQARLNQYVDGTLNDNFTLADRDKTLSSSGWTASWSGLPVIDAAGHALTYDVTEVGVFEGQNNVTAQFIAVETATGIKNYLATVDVPVTKVWDGGAEVPAGATVTAKIYQRERLVVDNGVGVASPDAWSGEYTAVTPEKTITITGTGTSWSGSATGLPKYRYDSAENDLYEIQYTAKEISVIADDGTDLTMDYISTSTANADGSVTITNTPPSYISLNVEKVWDDSNNASGVRPGSITVQLYRNDNFNVPMAGKDIVLNAANNWQGGWTDLDERYTYKAQELTVGGYAVSYSPANGVYAVTEGRNTTGDTVTITNTRVTPPTGSIEVKKVWQDTAGNTVSADLPENVQIELNRTAVQSGGTNVPIDLLIAYSNASSISECNNTEVTYYAHVGDTVMFTFTDFYYQYPTYTAFVSPEIKVAYWDTATNPDYYHYTEMSVSSQTVGNSRFVSFTVPDTTSICVRLNWGNQDQEENEQIINHSSFSGGGNVNLDPNTYPYTLTLSAANGWYASLSGLDTEHNAYTLKEIVPDGAAFVPVRYTINGTEQTANENGLVSVAPGVAVVTNQVKNGALKLTKTILVNNADPSAQSDTHADGTYTFTINGVTGTATAGVTKTVEITFTNSVASAYKIDNVETAITGGTNPYTVEVTDLLPGTYTITETAPTNGTTLTGATGGSSVDSTTKVVTVTVTAGKSGEQVLDTGKASFTNNINTGDLTVIKTVSGATADDANDEFSFTVTLTAPSGVTLASTYPATKTSSAAASNPTTFTVSSGSGTFTLKAGENYTIHGLPAGTAYSVVENTYSKYTSAITGGSTNNGTGTIANTAGSTVTVTVTNTRKTGNLALNKALTGDVPTDANKQLFTFKVTLSGATLAASYPLTWTGTRPDDVTTNRAPAVTLTAGTGTDAGKYFGEVQLVADETATITGLPTGVTYSVEEINPPHGYSESSDTGKTGTISTELSTAQITNGYTATGEWTVPVTKTFTNGNLTNKQFAFRLTQVESVNSVTQAATNVKLDASTTVSTSTSGNTTVQTVSFPAVTGFTSADVGKSFCFMIEEVLPDGLASPFIDSNGVKYDHTKYWVTITPAVSNGVMSFTETWANNATAAAFTNEQLGCVQVTKTFTFPDESGLTVPEGFKITASWTIDNVDYSAELTTSSVAHRVTTTDFMVSAATGSTPYTWTISNLPVGTMVTFTESGYEIAGYNVTSMVRINNGETATAGITGSTAAATTPGTVAFTNEYAAGIELPSTGGPGVILYTASGLALILGALCILMKRRRKTT